MEAFSTILKGLIDAIDLTIPVKSTNGNQVFVCKTLHLNSLREVEDTQGHVYKISDWSNNEWLQLVPEGGAPDPFNDTAIICPELTYLHGTPDATNSEFGKVKNRMQQKVPLVWLYENYRETINGRGSTFEREIIPRIFFLDSSKFDSWTTEKHHKFSIQPMTNLAEALAEVINKDRRFKTLQSYEIIPRARFGVFIDDRGNDRHILDADLSGVETQPILQKYKDYGCKCN